MVSTVPMLPLIAPLTIPCFGSAEFLFLPYRMMSGVMLIAAIAIKIDSKGNRKFRMVTHYGFEKNDISTVINQLKLILKK